ncbi:MAG: esterase-like activity of phytase family protein [Xanthomonadaceae bacterium]|nr:esterase-like activity of phytase family protein [Xanthomonadaceae bacterium]MDE1964149.1 esterase-like activity of phytase family protein [Xanthomonadaceae bacterium]
MPGRRVLTLALLLALPAAAQATVRLLAIGQLDAHRRDLSTATAAPLENGVPGNRLGGLGSAIDQVGCGEFVALPDRGPNAVEFDRAIDNTTSYINRIQTLEMALQPAPAGAPLPFTLRVSLRATTLLSSREPLAYGSGHGLGVGDGTPAANQPGRRYYFTGRSDGYDPAQPSSWPGDGRLDPESVRVSRDGRSVFVGEEYGPRIMRFDRGSGVRQQVYALPAALAVAHPQPRGHAEDQVNRSGRVGNHGIEGLALTPDGTVLYAALQGPLLQDGGKHGGYTRILRIDLATGAVRQFAYPLSRIGGRAHKPHFTGISDIVAIDGDSLLVDERDNSGLGSGTVARFKQVFRVDFAHARPLGDRQGQAALAVVALHKRPFLDVVAALTRHGVDAADIPAKLEGLSFGPDVRWRGRLLHTLYISSDNDFLADLHDRLHPDGIDNPNRFYVFGFTETDLPGFSPAAHPACAAGQARG